MEAVSLIWSFASTSLTSAVLSLRLLNRLFSRRRGGGEDDVADLRLYEGKVKHERRSPRHHAFEYAVRYAIVDLDRARSDPGRYFFPKSFFDGRLCGDEARAAAGTDGPVMFLSVPPSVGYEQNALCIYYCYDKVANNGRPGSNPDETSLRRCIAEVTNTPWGEKVFFTFDPKSDLVAKPLHVSPFMDIMGSWKLRVSEPGENLYVGVSVQHPVLGNYFTASLAATRIRPGVSPEVFFWLMPQKVAIWIYWQALKLWWKDVKLVQHPRYSSSDYREEAQRRDQQLSCPFSGVKNGGSRWFLWKDAAWPWC